MLYEYHRYISVVGSYHSVWFGRKYQIFHLHTPIRIYTQIIEK